MLRDGFIAQYGGFSILLGGGMSTSSSNVDQAADPGRDTVEDMEYRSSLSSRRYGPEVPRPFGYRNHLPVLRLKARDWVTGDNWCHGLEVDIK